MGKAYKSNNLPMDVTDEIEKIKAADLIIFQALLVYFVEFEKNPIFSKFLECDKAMS